MAKQGPHLTFVFLTTGFGVKCSMMWLCGCVLVVQGKRGCLWYPPPPSCVRGSRTSDDEMPDKESDFDISVKHPRLSFVANRYPGGQS